MVRDARLAQTWTGTNEIMSLLIQHEYYKELLNDPNPPRMSEADAEEAHLEDEKVYEDDEMWTKGGSRLALSPVWGSPRASGSPGNRGARAGGT